ncbi:hypothetical protein MBLNU459_g7414t1 [Dothideomycetes sp. NU459]
MKSSFAGLQTSDTAIEYASRVGATDPGISSTGGIQSFPTTFSGIIPPSSFMSTAAMSLKTMTTSLSLSATVTELTTTYIYSAPSSNAPSSNIGPGSASLCYTCALTPTVITTGSPASNSDGSNGATCTARKAVRTTTVFTTETVTACPTPLTCPNPGYALQSGYIGGSGSGSGGGDASVVVTTTNALGQTVTVTQLRGGAVILTTTNALGQTVTVTEVPTGTGMLSAGSGSPGSGPGSEDGASSGPGSQNGDSSSNGNSEGSGGRGGSGSSNSGGGGGPGNSGDSAAFGVATAIATATASSTPTATAVTGAISTAVPYCPYADGSTYSDTTGMLYQIICGRYVTESTLSAQNQTSLAACIAACDMFNLLTFTSPSACLGVSFFEAARAQGNCELKAGGDSVAQRFVDSARLLTPNALSGNGSADAGSSGGGGGGGGVGGAGVVGTLGTMALGPNTGISLVPSTIYGVATAVSTYVSDGVTLVSTYGISTALAVSYIYAGGGDGGGGGSTAPGTGVAAMSGAGEPGTGPGTGISLVPSTIYGVATAVSTFVSDGVTLVSTYGVSTALGVSYVAAPTTATATVTTTTVSVSVSVSVSAEPTTVVSTAPGGGTGGSGGGGGGGGVVTVTEGGGNYLTVTQVVTSYVTRSSSSSAFTCRTVVANYLGGGYGRVRKRSVFDVEGILMEKEGQGEEVEVEVEVGKRLRPGLGLRLKGQR